jgi:hypothetical protein
MFRVVCYRFVTVVVPEEKATHSTPASSSIRKLSAIAGGSALLLMLTLGADARDVRPPDSTAVAAAKPRHYFLPATAENVQWGWYDPKETPKLTVRSGDTVSIETLSHSLGRIKPGVEMPEIMQLRKENDGGGPHSITGPIYVEGAAPGDTLEVRILKIVPKPDARGRTSTLRPSVLSRFSQGRSDLDRRLPLPSRQRRGQPDGLRIAGACVRTRHADQGECLRTAIRVVLVARRASAADRIRNAAGGALTALRSGSGVLALDGAGGKVAPAEWRLARVANRHMREIALIIRDPEYLQIGATHLPGCLDQTAAQPDHLSRQLGVHTGDC